MQDGRVRSDVRILDRAQLAGSRLQARKGEPAEPVGPRLDGGAPVVLHSLDPRTTGRAPARVEHLARQDERLLQRQVEHAVARLELEITGPERSSAAAQARVLAR